MNIVNQLAIWLIVLYQKTLSPDKGLLRFWLQGRVCAHEPHCSEYGKQCFRRYPFFSALHYTMERIATCVPRYEKKYDPSSYRVVFFSSAPIGVPFLHTLAADKRFDLVGVVTMPDAPVGRGMKLQENIIKQEGKKIISGQGTMDNAQGYKKMILLHGKDATPEDKWYPWFIAQAKEHKVAIQAPYLPNSDNPVLEAWLQVIDTLDIDQDTCVIAHSRGGVALLRWIETRKKSVGKIVLIGTNDSVYQESKNGFFTDTDYAYEMIKSYCNDIVVLHATDDQTVPFAHGQKIAAGLGAKTRFPTGFGHFGKNLGETFEALLPFVFPPFVLTPRSLRLDSKKYAADACAFQQWVTELQPDLFVVIAYGHIMPQRVLDTPVFGSINVHGSLLPEYRGASPLQSVFLDGKTETGITVMKMDAGVDTGGMIKKLTIPLPFQRTIVHLIERIKQQGPAFLNIVLRDRCKGLLVLEQQDETKATLCRKFEKEDGQIDPFHDDLLQVRRKRQAFALWPKLYFIYEGKRVTIDTLLLEEQVKPEDIAGKTFFTTAGNEVQLHKSIATLRLVPEGKKPLTREQFVHGYVK